MIIICPIHGDFLQPPSRHLIGNGCTFCRPLEISKTTRFSNKYFVEKSIIIHNNKYDYSLANYCGSRSKVKIICPTHGIFEQIAGSHLSGKGCKLCANFNNRTSLENFIIKANIIHNYMYDYSKVVYVRAIDKVIIICKKHKEFEQTPSSHIGGSGCPRCFRFVSSPETEWLNSLNICQDFRNKRIFINKKRYNVDAYDPNTNTIYEFYGDYWHGNPAKFKAEDINPSVNMTFGELYKKTIEREKALKKANYNLIVIWENDFKRSKTI